MWARDVECMLGVWLLLSPFVFGHDPDATGLWASDLICAALVSTFALLSYGKPTQHAHLLTLLVALWLIGFGRFGAASPLPAGMQNNIVVGLLLLMFAIVPNHASRPPRRWFREAGGTVAG